jgi:hypothetical protein
MYVTTFVSGIDSVCGTNVVNGCDLRHVLAQLSENSQSWRLQALCLNQNFFSVPSPEFNASCKPTLTYIVGFLVVLGHLLYIPSYTICLTGPGTGSRFVPKAFKLPVSVQIII